MQGTWRQPLRIHQTDEAKKRAEELAAKRAEEKKKLEEEQKKRVEEAKKKVADPKGVYIPTKNDRIQLFSDYSDQNKAIGGSMVIIRKEDGKERKLLGGFFSAPWLRTPPLPLTEALLGPACPAWIRLLQRSQPA